MGAPDVSRVPVGIEFVDVHEGGRSVGNNGGAAFVVVSGDDPTELLSHGFSPRVFGVRMGPVWFQSCSGGMFLLGLNPWQS
jgi:hypothetical protein